MAPVFFPKLLYSQPFSPKCCTAAVKGEQEAATEPHRGHARQLRLQRPNPPTITVSPASAPSSLLPPLISVDPIDASVESKPTCLDIHSASHSINDQNVGPGPSLYTYNIDREALEILLSSDVETYIATASAQGLVITSLFIVNRDHAQHGCYLPPRLQHAPVILPISCVLFLWVFAMWYGRRRTGQTRTVEGEKLDLMGD